MTSIKLSTVHKHIHRKSYTTVSIYYIIDVCVLCDTMYMVSFVFYSACTCLTLSVYALLTYNDTIVADYFVCD